jgi:sugar fermentation stimulation protein A
MSRVDPDRQRPLADLPENRGLYLFLVRLREAARVKIGALGQHRLDAGWYVYTGHARRNLVQRVQRHFKPRKRVRWHIDRLVELPVAEPLGAVVLGTRDHPDWDECSLNRKIGVALDASAPVPGFGAGDCSGRCPAHLWYVNRPLSLLLLSAVSPRAAVVLPRGGKKGHDPSPEWPLNLPRYFQVETRHDD